MPTKAKAKPKAKPKIKAMFPEPSPDMVRHAEACSFGIINGRPLVTIGDYFDICRCLKINKAKSIDTFCKEFSKERLLQQLGRDVRYTEEEKDFMLKKYTDGFKFAITRKHKQYAETDDQRCLFCFIQERGLVNVPARNVMQNVLLSLIGCKVIQANTPEEVIKLLGTIKKSKPKIYLAELAELEKKRDFIEFLANDNKRLEAELAAIKGA